MASVGVTIPLQKERRGVVVGVCGPTLLVEQVREIHRKMDADLKYAYGGLELCEELSIGFSFCGLLLACDANDGVDIFFPSIGLSLAKPSEVRTR